MSEVGEAISFGWEEKATTIVPNTTRTYCPQTRALAGGKINREFGNVALKTYPVMKQPSAKLRRQLKAA